MRFKGLSVLIVALATLAVFTACGGKAGEDGSDTTGPIKVNFVAEGRFFKYTHASPLVMPDGSVIRNGDLKPFWQWIERRLGIGLDDVTTQSTASAIIQTQSAIGFRDSNIYGGNSIASDLMRYGTQGRFIDLVPFINEKDMPNFNEFLQTYPAIRQAITAHDGGIYFIPYVAEIGYIARAFLGRQSWVRALLDGAAPFEQETATLNVEYSGFWLGENARYDTNVIALQNAAATNGVLNFVTARRILVEYIREKYPEYQRPSDLFLGSGSRHDIDELVALWRVVRLAPNTLSRITTGSVVPGAEIVPYFIRQTNQRECIFRLANYFNGQRVFGADSYSSNFFLDADGVLQFSYNNDFFLFEALPHIRAMFAEGLISPDFANTSLRTNLRAIYLAGDLRPGHNQFGFMTKDFIPSTTNMSLGDGLMQTDVGGFLPPVTRIPGVVNGFVHFLENTRTVKPDGWSISTITGGEKLRSIIRLFDFMFSEEGYVAQNFGMPEMIDDEPFINTEGVAFPKMNAWFNEQSELFANGDGALFSRSFVGFNHPIGYQKSIGFEQQFTSIYGEQAWALYGSVDMFMPSYDSENPYFTLVPPVFSFDSRLQRQLQGTNVGESQTDMLFSFITTGTPSPQQIREAYTNGRGDDFLRIHRDAFAMMRK